jgi:xanthine dehydrogenase accessory factor
MDTLFERIVQCESQGEDAVLVIVVEQERSSPGVPGAKMLVTAEGPTSGTVGGGALELRAIFRARELDRKSVV